MRSLFFWNTWNREYRILWHILLVFFASSILFMWYGYLQAPEGLTEWNKYQEQKTSESISHVFEVGNFEFVVPIDSYSTFEYFNAGPLQVKTLPSYVFVITIILMSILLFSVITTFSRFWYFVGTGLFILFIVSLRLDVLELFGARNQLATLVSVTIYVAVSYYFNSFNTTASFTLRLVTFFLLSLILGTIIYFYSAIEYPLLYMAVSSYIPGLILTVIFIFMMAHEIIAGFVYLTSQSTTSSKSLRHFAIISLIYMVNLVFAYMNEAGLIHWNFIFINLYLLFTLSGVLAIWGYHTREHLYENIVSFNPFGAFFIIGLGIIAFTTTGMFLGIYNDVALKIVRDIIIFSHIGFGGIFLLYFTSNFIGVMAANKNAYKVLYYPVSMPYATYRIAGLIATFAFIFYSQWNTYVYYGTAGIYNSMGDVQQLMDKVSASESYYRQSGAYAVKNFHSNYILAGIETANNDLKKAHTHYNNINWTQPTESSLINDANLYLLEDKHATSSALLEGGLKVFPKSGVLKNNLGYFYLKQQISDSAFLLFDQTRNDALAGESSEINISGLFAHLRVALNADSLVSSFSKPSDAVISNSILIATHQGKSLTTKVDVLKKTQLDLYSATLLNNYIVNKLKEVDTTFINNALKISDDSLNEDYMEALNATLSQAYYYQNNVAKAFSLMGEIAFITQSLQGKFNYTMGLWALEQGNPLLAVKCFAYSVEKDYKEAKTYNAIALAEAGLKEDALIAAETLLESRNQSDREIGTQLKNVLTISPAQALMQTDLQKYQYCRYRIGLRDSIGFNRIVNTIENTNYKALILLEMAQRQFASGSMRSAIRYFNKLDGIRFTDKTLNEKIIHFELELLASQNEVRLLAPKINAGVSFPQEKQLHKMLYTALISEASGDTLTAQRNYEILAVYNPFFEEGIIAAARYFKDHSADKLKAYTILAEAKQVNPGSIRLLMAYISEATRIGFDDFAADAYEELNLIRSQEK
jgi:hypothetical protein